MHACYYSVQDLYHQRAPLSPWAIVSPPPCPAEHPAAHGVRGGASLPVTVDEAPAAEVYVYGCRQNGPPKLLPLTLPGGCAGCAGAREQILASLLPDLPGNGAEREYRPADYDRSRVQRCHHEIWRLHRCPPRPAPPLLLGGIEKSMHNACAGTPSQVASPSASSTWR